MTFRKPIVCISASLLPVANARFTAHAVGEKNVDALETFSQCIPLVLPAVGSRLDTASLVSQIDGLVLTGGRANVEPHHYDGPAFPPDEPIDPGRDGAMLAMTRACIAAKLPVFGICRGIQELNVALGGSLHYRIHLLPGKADHRMPRHEDATPEEIFRPNHPIQLKSGGLFESLVSQSEVIVNSLHGQGIDRIADRLEVEATSPDGVIEGVRLKDDETFTVGVQWHAEWEPQNHELSRKLFEHFGDAAAECARRRANN